MIMARNMRPWALVLMILMATLWAFADAEDSVAELVAKADSAPVDKQPELYIKAAQHQLKNANSLYDAGKSEEAAAAVKDISTYSGKATEAAGKSRKRLKNTEIDVRKMAEKLRDIKRTLNFDDQATVQDTIDHLETFRTRLLSQMFSKEKK